MGMRVATSSAAVWPSGGISSTTLSGSTSSRCPPDRLSWVQFTKMSFLPTSSSVPACERAVNTRMTSVAAVWAAPLRERLNSS
ncbi:hypothetical protein D3C72_1828960 [compost metagenome]